MCAEVLQSLDDDDFIQVILKTPSLQHHVSTKLMKKRFFSVQNVMIAIQDAAQSSSEIKLGDGIRVEFVTVRRQHPQVKKVGGGRYKCKTRNPLKVAYNRLCMVEIHALDNSCLARSIVVAKAKLEKDPRYDDFLRRSPPHADRLGAAARSLCTAANVEWNKKAGIEEVRKFERYLKMRIMIIAGDCLNQFVYEGHSNRNWPSIYIYRTDVSEGTLDEEGAVLEGGRRLRSCGDDDSYHYDAITDVKAFFSTNFFCTACNVCSNRRFLHRCSDVTDWCSACNQRECTRDALFVEEYCPVCQVKFRSNQCAKDHKLKENQRECTHYTCRFCYEALLREIRSDGTFETNDEIQKRHGVCPIKCSVCDSDSVSASHKCYMQRVPFKKPVNRVVYLDFETDQSTGVHKVVYCYIRWKFEGSAGSVEEGSKEFGIAQDVKQEVGKFLFSSKFRESTIVAHNMRGFDGCFLVQFLTGNGITPTNVILSGTKLVSFYVRNYSIKIIDSLSFLPMPLSDFPQAFGLNSSQFGKGYFPHFYTCPEKFGVVENCYPDKKYYGYAEMSAKQRTSFDAWYSAIQPGQQFDFDQELKSYCKQDVDLLYEGVEAFRQTVKSLTSQVTLNEEILVNENKCSPLNGDEVVLSDSDEDLPALRTLPTNGRGRRKNKRTSKSPSYCDPLAYITLASLCHAIFKALFLKPGTIAVVPPGGYNNHRYSNISLEWLEWLRRTSVPRMRHRGNSATGERKIGAFRVDGFDAKSKVIYEFYGCFFHGHPSCIEHMQAIHPVAGVTYQCLFDRTMEREKSLQKRGFRIVRMWSCKWDKYKKEHVPESEALLSILEDMKGFAPINVRESFKGGRTETFKMKSEGVPLYYYDVNSLYPFVLAHRLFGVGHPVVLIDNLDHDLEKYFGFLKCDVLPPKQLYHPVLPLTVEGKLVFPLCSRCAFSSCTKECNHSDKQRMLRGTWFSEELKLALQKGYTLIRIYQVTHFPKQSTMLFKAYVQTMYKVKILSSGLPKGCNSKTELRQFIQEVYEREGIKLDEDDFKDNPCMRSLAKLLLNAFWGRFALREHQTSCEFVATVDKLNSILNRDSIEITSLRPIGKNMAVVFYRAIDEEVIPMSNNTNIYIASTTTAWARIELYKYLDQCCIEEGDSSSAAMYCDTDSIIFSRSVNLPTGPHLGQLTSELQPNDFILRFVSAGPKTYAFETRDGETCVKAKGFSLTYTNGQVLNIDGMLSLVNEFLSVYSVSGESRVQLPSYKSWRKEKKGDRQLLYRRHKEVGAHSSAVLDSKRGISFFSSNKIHRTPTWDVIVKPEQKFFSVFFNKRIVCSDFNTVPFGFVP